MIYVTRSFFKGKCHLLDIAVGRGGDLDKWNKAGITSVFGFDARSSSSSFGVDLGDITVVDCSSSSSSSSSISTGNDGKVF
jgi:hypothetical protein